MTDIYRTGSNHCALRETREFLAGDLFPEAVEGQRDNHHNGCRIAAPCRQRDLNAVDTAPFGIGCRIDLHLLLYVMERRIVVHHVPVAGKRVAEAELARMGPRSLRGSGWR
jgi:hypothetical protein